MAREMEKAGLIEEIVGDAMDTIDVRAKGAIWGEMLIYMCGCVCV